MSDVQEPLPWGRSSATVAVLEQLVADRLLPLNPISGAPAWIAPLPEETEPKPPQATLGASCVFTSGASSSPSAGLCGPYASATERSYITSAPTPSHRRRSSSPSAR